MNAKKSLVRKTEDEQLRRRGPIIVFVKPLKLHFNCGDTTDDRKQILTIMNPWDFPIRYTLKCTQPKYYDVADSQNEGSISAKHYVDVVIRVLDFPLGKDSRFEHTFRINYYDMNDKKYKQSMAQKDVPSIIEFGNLTRGSNAALSGRSAHSRLQSSPEDSDVGGNSGYKEHPISHSSFPKQQFNYSAFLVAIICIIGLMLPISRESCNCNCNGDSAPSARPHQESVFTIPPWLHPPVGLTQIFSFLLGISFIFIVRP